MGVGVRACARVFPAAGIRHAAASLWVYKADCQGRGGQGAAHGACHGLCSRRLGHPGPSESESAPTFSRRDGTAGPEHLGILACICGVINIVRQRRPGRGMSAAKTIQVRTR